MFSLPNIAFSQTHQYQNAAPGYFDTHLDAASEIAARCAAVATHGDSSAGLYGSKPHYFGEFGLKGRLAVSIRYNVMSMSMFLMILNRTFVVSLPRPVQDRNAERKRLIKSSLLLQYCQSTGGGRSDWAAHAQCHLCFCGLR